MIQEHSVAITKTVRYCTLGRLDEATRHLWIVLHGYGQLAKFFIKKFEILVDDSHTIIAPEGMHRFYLEGTSGRVGASWMTSEARLDDIKDQQGYLSQLISIHTTKCNRDVQIHLLGFSQGVATCMRFLANTSFEPASLTLWAGSLPTDIDYAMLCEKLLNTQTVVVRGIHDPYFASEDAEVLTQPLAKNLIPFGLYEFEGGHDIDRTTLYQIKNTLNTLD